MIKKDEEEVIWKPYPEYPFIEANQFSEIRTVDRVVTRSNGTKYYAKGHILKQWNNGYGYLIVRLSVNGKTINLYVHRIVAICFLPNPNNYPVVNHKDNDRTNNAVSNLEWCTKEYNEAYKKNFGTSQVEVSGQPVIAVSLDSFKVFCFESQSEAGRQLGIDVRSVNGVIKG